MGKKPPGYATAAAVTVIKMIDSERGLLSSARHKDQEPTSEDGDDALVEDIGYFE